MAEEGPRELGSRRTINHAVMVRSHVNLNRERTVRAASLAGVREFDALRSKIYTHTYVAIYPYAHSVFTPPWCIRGRASLSRLLSKTPSSLAKLISFADRKFDGVSGRRWSDLHVVVCGMAWRSQGVCGDTCRRGPRGTLRSMH